jgi:hypothetical protein
MITAMTFDQRENIVWTGPYRKCGYAITPVPENLKDAMPIRSVCQLQPFWSIPTLNRTRSGQPKA